MATVLKMGKKKKLPKKPKMTASMDRWKAYEKAAKAVIDYNKKIAADFERRKKEVVRVMTEKKRIAGIGKVK